MLTIHYVVITNHFGIILTLRCIVNTNYIKFMLTLQSSVEPNYTIFISTFQCTVDRNLISVLNIYNVDKNHISLLRIYDVDIVRYMTFANNVKNNNTFISKSCSSYKISLRIVNLFYVF